MQMRARGERSTVSPIAFRCAVALSAFTGVARAQEDLPNCVLDSDCARGRCIDLVCVDTEKPRSPGATPPPSASGEEPAPDAGAPAPKAAPLPAPAPAAPAVRPAERAEPQPGAASRRPRVGFPVAVTPAPDRERAPAPQGGTKQPRKGTVAARWSGERERQEPARDESQDEEEKPARVWYGVPLIVTYGAVATIGALTLSSRSSGELLAVSLFAAPIVHWANKRVAAGFLALVMQPVAAGIGYAAFAGGKNPSDAPGIEAMFAGYAAWAAFDIGLVAYKDAPRQSSSLRVFPLVGRGISGAGVSGAF